MAQFQLIHGIKHFPDDMVTVHLINKSYCQPLLIYAYECFNMLRNCTVMLDMELYSLANF